MIYYAFLTWFGFVLFILCNMTLAIVDLVLAEERLDNTTKYNLVYLSPTYLKSLFWFRHGRFSYLRIQCGSPRFQLYIYPFNWNQKFTLYSFPQSSFFAFELGPISFNKWS